MTHPIIESARKQGRFLLNEVESKRVAADAGIPGVPTMRARSRGKAVEIATQMGYPIALKVVSDAIPHKSAVGGVRLNLSGAVAVAEAFDAVLRAAHAAVPDATLNGVTIQPMAPRGVEIILGFARDPEQAMRLLCGLGGVDVEEQPAVATRSLPLQPGDARALIGEAPGLSDRLAEAGVPAAIVDRLVAALEAAAALAQAEPTIAELDLNPVIASPTGLVAVDARIVLG